MKLQQSHVRMAATVAVIIIVVLIAVYLGAGMFVPPVVMAHCDTLDGPVVSAAKAALERGDVTPVLRWVQPHDEATIRSAFAKALAVRAKGPEARELADMYFFETLVRIHRAGEGAPYEGIMPAGTVEPGIAEADAAVATGSVDALAHGVAEKVGEGIRHRFERAMELKGHADESVEAGRRYVEAYVEFIHYVERLHNDIAAQAEHQEHEMHRHE
jgi:hypothetical protein